MAMWEDLEFNCMTRNNKSGWVIWSDWELIWGVLGGFGIELRDTERKV